MKKQKPYKTTKNITTQGITDPSQQLTFRHQSNSSKRTQFSHITHNNNTRLKIFIRSTYHIDFPYRQEITPPLSQRTSTPTHTTQRQNNIDRNKHKEIEMHGIYAHSIHQIKQQN